MLEAPPMTSADTTSQVPLALDWGGQEIVLRPSRAIGDGGNLWSAEMDSGARLDAMRVRHVCKGIIGWKVSVSGVVGGEYVKDGEGWTLSDAVTECRENLDLHLKSLRDQVAILTKTLGKETP